MQQQPLQPFQSCQSQQWLHSATATQHMHTLPRVSFRTFATTGNAPPVPRAPYWTYTITRKKDKRGNIDADKLALKSGLPKDSLELAVQLTLREIHAAAMGYSPPPSHIMENSAFAAQFILTMCCRILPTATYFTKVSSAIDSTLSRERL